MGRRNNKLCDQKGHDPKVVRQAKDLPKEILPWSKGPFQRTITDLKTDLKQLTFLDLFNIYNFFVKLLNNDRE